MYISASRSKFEVASRTVDQAGQAIVEFLFVAITFLFCTLGIIQLAMVLNAYSLVRYAAYNAARAAIVHGGNHDTMQEAARLSLVATFPKHGRADHRRGFDDNYTAAQASDTIPGRTYFNKPITSVQILDSGIPCGTVVAFDDPRDADRALITVQVVHQYQLVIPLVNRLTFWLWWKLESGGTYGGESLDKVAQVTDRMRRSGEFTTADYRIPLVAHYTMRMQSDYAAEACPPPPPPPPPPPEPPPPPPTPVPTPTPCPASGSFCGAILANFYCAGPYGCVVPDYARNPGCSSCCQVCMNVEGLGYDCWRAHCAGNFAGAPCYCY